MSETEHLSPEILLHISQGLNISMNSLVATIGLLDEGGTVPFIARYRKEATGALDEVKIRDIEEQLLYFRDLLSRRKTILASIAEQESSRTSCAGRSNPLSTRASSKTSISRTGPNAAPRPPSPVKEVSSRSPTTSALNNPHRSPSSNSPRPLSTKPRTSQPSAMLSKAPGILSRNASPRQPTFGKLCASSFTMKA